MNPHIRGEDEKPHRVASVMLSPCLPPPQLLESKTEKENRVKEGVRKVDNVTERKEETPPIVRKLHLRPACQHLETEVFNTGRERQGLPTPLWKLG